jgi:hypothetical protein
LCFWDILGVVGWRKCWFGWWNEHGLRCALNERSIGSGWLWSNAGVVWEMSAVGVGGCREERQGWADGGLVGGFEKLRMRGESGCVADKVGLGGMEVMRKEVAG